jgi:hypothetical protein
MPSICDTLIREWGFFELIRPTFATGNGIIVRPDVPESEGCLALGIVFGIGL